MRSALIGHTGFVGGNLLDQGSFTHLYNSRTIDSIRGEEFDLLVCAGVSAEKWRANRDPDADRAALQRLMQPLAAVRTRRAVLISTVDVFGQPMGVDELTPVEPSHATPYGRHRYQLEEFFRARFDTLVVRLPGLFGRGLKKNAIYDFLHDNQTDRIHSDAVFQFYDLGDLTADIGRAISDGLSLLHCATEPISVTDMVRFAFGRDFVNHPTGVVPARYDLRSRHAALFSGTGHYLRDKATVFTALRHFVQSHQNSVTAGERRCA